MSFPRRHSAFLTMSAVLSVSCATDTNRLTAPRPTFDASPALHAVSGTVYGPSGVGICDDFTSGTVLVRLLRPGTAVGGLGLQDRLFADCPSVTPISFAFTVPENSYYLTVTLLNGPLGTLPQSYVDPVAVALTGDVVRDLHVPNGAPFGGLVTLDGQPAAGVPLSLRQNLPIGGYIAVNMTSDAAGAWGEPAAQRSPVYLQPDLAYRAPMTGPQCAVLGAWPGSALPEAPFLFPGERNALNWAFTSNSAPDRTHVAGRLAVTPDAGDIGGLSPSACGVRGSGFGVQFPIPPSGPVQLPAVATQLFRGGFLIGLAPDVVLSGMDMSGYDLRCGGPAGDQCHDLGVNATMHAATPDPHDAFITWRYSDVTSAESRGIEVTQRSFTGRGDYVLFQFTIKNGGRTTLTFWAGTIMDWDVDGNASDDITGIDLDGQLMYVTNAWGGNQLGTLILGTPASGTYGYVNSVWQSTTRQVDALRGAVSVPAIGPNDVRAIHGAGPFTLDKGHAMDLWLAIVAGEDHAALLAAADLARADFARNGRGVN